MIDYKDLQMGNYVKIYSGEVYQVESIYYDMIGLVNSDNFIEQIMCDRIYPIEVTEELLMKIGFEKNEIVVDGFRVLDRTYDLPFGDCFIEIREGVSNSVGRGLYCHIDNCAHSTIGGFDFQYLHELQNGIRLITKNDLDIKL